jgi:hypothetical protein
MCSYYILKCVAFELKRWWDWLSGFLKLGIAWDSTKKVILCFPEKWNLLRNVILLFSQIWRYFVNRDMQFSKYQYKFCKITFLWKWCTLINITFSVWKIRSPVVSTKCNITFTEKSVSPLKTGKCAFPENVVHFLKKFNSVFRVIDTFGNALLQNAVVYYMYG